MSIQGSIESLFLATLHCLLRVLGRGRNTYRYVVDGVVDMKFMRNVKGDKNELIDCRKHMSFRLTYLNRFLSKHRNVTGRNIKKSNIYRVCR